MKWEQVASNKTSLNQYVPSGILGSVGSLSQKDRVKSQSFMSKVTCKNALSMSDEIANLFSRTCMPDKSFKSGGVDSRHGNTSMKPFFSWASRFLLYFLKMWRS